MRIRGLGRLRWMARRVRNRLFPGALIVRYHRVAELAADPFEQAVTPRAFAEHLEVLRKHAVPVSLQTLAQGLREGSLPRRAVAVTLGDGYADNLYHAKPLLEKHEIPATVYVVSGHVGQTEEFWWDELERLLLQPGTLPPTLRLSAQGRAYCWELESAAEHSEEDWRRHRHWRLGDAADPTPRHRLCRELHALLYRLPPEARTEVLRTLRAWSGDAHKERTTHRVLTPEELCRLADGGLIEIGGHTATHSALSHLPYKAQQEEIQVAKTFLETALGRPVTSFAYPYGDYTPETVTAVREAGFTSATTISPTLMREQADPHQMPRVWAREWDGDQFARQLRGWFRE